MSGARPGVRSIVRGAPDPAPVRIVSVMASTILAPTRRREGTKGPQMKGSSLFVGPPRRASGHPGDPTIGAREGRAGWPNNQGASFHLRAFGPFAATGRGEDRGSHDRDDSHGSRVRCASND